MNTSADMVKVERLEKFVVSTLGSTAEHAGETDVGIMCLAARLCERVAYNNAGSWTADGVAELLVISAQLQRRTMDPNALT